MWQDDARQCHRGRARLAFLQGKLYIPICLLDVSSFGCMHVLKGDIHKVASDQKYNLNLLFLQQASGPELVGGTSGESEERIRQIFESAAASGPSVLFIDAIDVIAGKKDVSQPVHLM